MYVVVGFIDGGKSERHICNLFFLFYRGKYISETQMKEANNIDICAYVASISLIDKVTPNVAQLRISFGVVPATLKI